MLSLSHWFTHTVARPVARAAAAVAASIVFGTLPVDGWAQGAGSTISGTVVDRSSGARVTGALVISTTDSRAVTTDSAGQFVLSGLPGGPVRFVVRAAGFPVATLNLTLPANDTLFQLVRLDSTGEARSGAQRLPDVPINAPASMGRRYEDFERRQKTGRGHYLTAADIDRRGFTSLQDAVRTLRGVEVECGGGGGCFIRMARAPMRCLPEYIVDERVDNMFGPRTPIRDIQALEVYTGPSDVPGEFAGRNAGCGVIVIWTRSGPTRP